MSNYKIKIDEIQRELFLKKFQNELNEYDILDVNEYNIIDESDYRKSYLEKIIKIIQAKKNNVVREIKYEAKKEEKNTVYSNNMNNYFNQLNNLMFQKRWNSLKKEHKKEKLIEWVNKQELTDEKKESLKVDIIYEFENKLIYTEKHISYNKDLMEIEEIFSVKIDIPNNSYNILKKK